MAMVVNQIQEIENRNSTPAVNRYPGSRRGIRRASFLQNSISFHLGDNFRMVEIHIHTAFYAKSVFDFWNTFIAQINFSRAEIDII